MGGQLCTRIRLEWRLAIISLVFFLVSAEVVARRTPPEIRWFVWLYNGGLSLVFGLCAVLLARHVRRRGLLRQREDGPGAAGASRPQTSGQLAKRIKLYLAAAALSALTATDLSTSGAFRRHFAVTTGEIFLWEFVTFALLVVVVELSARWKALR